MARSFNKVSMLMQRKQGHRPGATDETLPRWECCKGSAQSRSLQSWATLVQHATLCQSQPEGCSIGTLLCSCSDPSRAPFVPRQQLYQPSLIATVLPALPRRPSEFHDPMPAGTHLTGMCTKPGVAGGLTLLGALHRSPLACISLKGLAAQGGFQAAYLGVSDVIRHKGFQ